MSSRYISTPLPHQNHELEPPPIHTFQTTNIPLPTQNQGLKSYIKLFFGLLFFVCLVMVVVWMVLRCIKPTLYIYQSSLDPKFFSVTIEGQLRWNFGVWISGSHHFIVSCPFLNNICSVHGA